MTSFIKLLVFAALVVVLPLCLSAPTNIDEDLETFVKLARELDDTVRTLEDDFQDLIAKKAAEPKKPEMMPTRGPGNYKGTFSYYGGAKGLGEDDDQEDLAEKRCTGPSCKFGGRILNSQEDEELSTKKEAEVTEEKTNVVNAESGNALSHVQKEKDEATLEELLDLLKELKPTR